MARIAVVGGGFGGTYAIRALSYRHDITLFDPRDRFIFTPLLHEVAGGVLDKEAVSVPYATLFGNRKRFKHVRKAVTRIDLNNKSLIAGKKYRYDAIIIAPGATTNFFGNTFGQEVHTLKTFDDAIHIRQELEQNVITASRLLHKNPTADVASLLHCVIVGAGPTGVELAGEAMDLLQFRLRMEGITHKKPHVTLITSTPRVLQHLDGEVAKAAHNRLEEKGVVIVTNTKVIEIENDIVKVAGKKKKEYISKCVVWTAGISPNTIHSEATADRKPFHVERTLQLKEFPYAFALGDGSRMTPPLPALAQVASQQGTHTAKNVERYLTKKKTLPFSFKERGILVSVGQKYGVGRAKGVLIKGFGAWFIMRTVYLFKFKNAKQEFRTALEYTIRLFVRDKLCAARRVARSTIRKSFGKKQSVK